MRFQINLDCTPEEARDFFGLPDIVPFQQAMMEEISRRMSDGIQNMDPDTLMKTWVPAMFQGMSQMQQNLWAHMGEASTGQEKENPSSGKSQKSKSQQSNKKKSQTKKSARKTSV